MGNFFKSLFSSSKEEKAENGTDTNASKTDQKNFDIFKYDGVRAQRMGQLAYAIKCFEEALKIQDDYETMGMLVSAYLTDHDFEKALAMSDRMVEEEPEEVTSFLTRANALFVMGKESDVIADCLRVIELDDTNYSAWYMMARGKQSIKDLQGAVEDLTKAIALKDDIMNAWLLRAEVLLEMDKAEEALSDIEEAIKLVPEEESVYLLRGRIHESLNNFEAATEDYNQALALNPFNEEASLLSASLLIKENRPDEAIVILDEIIELKPDFAKAYRERGKAKELKNDREGAAEDLRKGEELENAEQERDAQSDGQQSNFDNMYKGGIY